MVSLLVRVGCWAGVGGLGCSWRFGKESSHYSSTEKVCWLLVIQWVKSWLAPKLRWKYRRFMVKTTFLRLYSPLFNTCELLSKSLPSAVTFTVMVALFSCCSVNAKRVIDLLLNQPTDVIGQNKIQMWFLSAEQTHQHQHMCCVYVQNSQKHPSLIQSTVGAA